MLRNWNLHQWHLLTGNIDFWRDHFLSDISNIWKETSSVNLFTEGNFMMSRRIFASLTSSSFLYLELDIKVIPPCTLIFFIFFIFFMFYIIPLFLNLHYQFSMRKKLWKENTWELTNINNLLKLKRSLELVKSAQILHNFSIKNNYIQYFIIWTSFNTTSFLHLKAFKISHY